MQHLSSLAEMAETSARLRAAGKSVALVPTMGSLHAGKLALISAAAGQADAVIVSIFVNPLQFGPNEHPARYPRPLADDLGASQAGGAHTVFTPSSDDLLPRGFATYLTEETLSKALCGPSRPGHFRGVATLTGKLFNLLRPATAYFGQKTAQRAAVVRKLGIDLGYDTKIVIVPTVREADGLAAGTANRSFTPTLRHEALALSRALAQAKTMAEAGTRSPDRLVAEAIHILGEHRRVRVIYVSVVDTQTLEPAREVVPGRHMMAIAAWVDEVRLVDNVLL